jgi:uncharacterized protein (UPF0333 family)
MRRTAMRGQSVLAFALLIALVVFVIIMTVYLIGPQVNRCSGCGLNIVPTATPFQGTQVSTP